MPKKKHKSPSTFKHEKARMERFLNKKCTVNESPAAENGKALVHEKLTPVAVPPAELTENSNPLSDVLATRTSVDSVCNTASPTDAKSSCTTGYALSTPSETDDSDTDTDTDSESYETDTQESGTEELPEPPSAKELEESCKKLERSVLQMQERVLGNSK